MDRYVFRNSPQTKQKVILMGFMDKLKNSFKREKGAAKEQVGRDQRDPYLEAEGRKERYEGGVKQVGEQIKDAAKEARRTVK
ncbi:CsbD family protein [Actinocorallia longicatena]|uniref:CsbD-like protein n=1 Tax=Actinocorallia longicatena TaxID=111803 RepID=A0ABP6Q5N3_9ACTN